MGSDGCKKEMINSIYILKCPKTNFIKYVGISNNTKRRALEHKRKDTNNHRYNWIKSLTDKGRKPIMEILESGLNREVALKRESMYIEMFRSIGYKLTNKSNGGDNPPSQKGKFLNETQKREKYLSSPLKKVVIQKNKQGEIIAEFNGVREACRVTSIDHRSISQVASGSNIRKSAGGYLWEYKVKRK